MAVRPIGIWHGFYLKHDTSVSNANQMRYRVLLKCVWASSKRPWLWLWLWTFHTQKTKTFPRSNCVNNTSNRNQSADVALAQLKSIRTLGVCRVCLCFIFVFSSVPRRKRIFMHSCVFERWTIFRFFYFCFIFVCVCVCVFQLNFCFIEPHHSVQTNVHRIGESMA